MPTTTLKRRRRLLVKQKRLARKLNELKLQLPKPNDSPMRTAESANKKLEKLKSGGSEKKPKRKRPLGSERQRSVVQQRRLVNERLRPRRENRVKKRRSTDLKSRYPFTLCSNLLAPLPRQPGVWGFVSEVAPVHLRFLAPLLSSI